MPYYLYRRPDGKPEVSTFKMPAAEMLGYTLVRTCEDCPRDDGMAFDADDNLVIDPAELRRRKKVLVEAEVKRKKRAKVEYDGTLLDADEPARTAFSTKKNELEVRSTVPGAQLFWKDANNGRRTFSNTNEFRNFVHGALAAITARDSEVDTWAFATRDAIDAITDPAELAALVVTEDGQTGAEPPPPRTDRPVPPQHVLW